jgi:hypothetical protein
MPSPTAEEKRGSPRYPLERLAKIQLGVGNSPRYCLITDMSDGGVRVNTFGFEVPDEFVLLLSGDGPARDGTYKVIWRLGHDVGAKLVSRENAQGRTINLVAGI